MPKVLHLLFALALCPIAVPAAEARIPTEKFERIELGGLRLGMTYPQAEAILRSRRAWSEPGGTLGANYDCGSLAPEPQAAPFDTYAGPRLPESLYFSDAAHRGYGVKFGATPAGAIATGFGYRDWGINIGWRAYLAAVVQRYGEPDLIKPGKKGEFEAYWCEEGVEKCDEQAGDKGNLYLNWVPWFGMLEGDRTVQDASAVFNLDEGSERARARYDSNKALAAADPETGRRLYAQCLSPEGKFADDNAYGMHILGLVHYFEGESVTILDARQVPDGVFAAIGIDAKRTFAEGICFQSSDAVFERPECPRGVSFTGLRWVQRSGNRWLLSMKYGGAALQRRYYVVEQQPDGSFRKIWWDRDLASLSRWLDKGAKPMTGESW